MGWSKWDLSRITIQETKTLIPKGEYENKMRCLAELILRSPYTPKQTFKGQVSKRVKSCEKQLPKK